MNKNRLTFFLFLLLLPIYIIIFFYFSSFILFVIIIDIIKIEGNKDILEVDPDKSKTKEFTSLKEFADSCEIDRKFNQAALYHQERIARWEDSYQAW